MLQQYSIVYLLVYSDGSVYLLEILIFGFSEVQGFFFIFTQICSKL